MLFRLLLPMMLFLGFGIAAKSLDEENYCKIESHYRSLLENDRHALPFVRSNIATAKKNRNIRTLLWSYEDAVFFTPEKNIKLSYADSILAIAKSTAQPGLIADAWLGRGIIYAFNFKDYQAALDNYIQAFQYSSLQNDPYLFHRIEYQMGVIKSYLGYNTEALIHFENALDFFREQRKDAQSVTDFNYTRAYLNCIHQISIIYRRLNRWKDSGSLCNMGYGAIGAKGGFEQEKAYMNKEKGIVYHRQARYKAAILLLESALPLLYRLQDATNFSVACYYMGNSQRALGNYQEALVYYRKIDSVFSATGYLSPEIRSTYTILIDDARKNNNRGRLAFYTAQLISADSSIIKNYAALPGAMFSGYDAVKIRMESQVLLKNEESEEWLKDAGIIMACTVAGLIVIVLIWKKKERSRAISLFPFYKNKGQKLMVVEGYKSDREKLLAIKSDVLAKLKEFERSNEFLNEDLNVTALAKEMNTNRSYLSNIINDEKHMSFPQYVASLRINYITKKLRQERIYLSYSVDALAKICGITSRKTFARHFRKINGVAPFEFINKIKKEQNKT